MQTKEFYNEVADLWNLRELMKRNRLLFMYGERFSLMNTAEVFRLAEQKLQHTKETGLKKKIMHVMLEVLQNITQNICTDEFDTMLVIGKEENNNYFVLSGKAIISEQESEFREKLESINSLGADGLRKLYRVTLEYNKTGEKDSELGLITIARRANNKLQYHFTELGNGCLFFTFKVELSKKRIHKGPLAFPEKTRPEA